MKKKRDRDEGKMKMKPVTLFLVVALIFPSSDLC